MSYDPNLGQLMEGGRQLQRIPPNASRDEQLVIINDAIDALNNYSRDVVASGLVPFPINGADGQVLTIPHNLGYSPRASVYLNQVTLQIGSTIYPNVDIPLPTYLSEFIPSGFGGGGTGLGIQFSNWMDFFVDATNLYVHFINPDHAVGTLNLSYELRRQAAR